MATDKKCFMCEKGVAGGDEDLCTTCEEAENQRGLQSLMERKKPCRACWGPYRQSVSGRITCDCYEGAAEASTADPHDDDLIGTFAVITPEKWAELRTQLETIPLGHLWVEYEAVLDESKMLEWQLGDPDSHMPPVEIQQRVIDWDTSRQMEKMYEQIMLEKGWDGRGVPEDVPCCRVCSYRMSHWDRRVNVCDECDQEMKRDEYNDWRREEGRYR